MTKEKAAALLKSLLDGVDPVTGEVLPEDHACCTPQVMRALHEAILALGGGNQPEAAGHAPPGPGRLAGERDRRPFRPPGGIHRRKAVLHGPFEGSARSFETGKQRVIRRR